MSLGYSPADLADFRRNRQYYCVELKQGIHDFMVWAPVF